MRTREASLGSGLFKNTCVDHAQQPVAEAASRHLEQRLEPCQANAVEAQAHR